MDLATLHFDTYKVVKLLQEKGYSEKEAEGFILAIQEVTLSGVATKQGLQDVKEGLGKEIQDVKESLGREIQDVKDGLGREIQGVKDELKTEINGFRNEVMGEIAQLKNETLKVLMVHSITIVGVVVALFQFFAK